MDGRRLDGNGITEIQAGTFTGLGSLTELSVWFSSRSPCVHPSSHIHPCCTTIPFSLLLFWTLIDICLVDGVWMNATLL